MDLLSPLCEFDQIDDLFPLSPLHELTIQNDHHNHHLPSLEKEKILLSKPDRKRKSTKPIVEKIEYQNKKAIHRDVERLRRQEMAALNRSLKSLLPPESVKGKRSLCDHMLQTVIYIREMQNKLQELTKMRDFLNKSSNKLTINVGSKCLPGNLDGSQAADDEISNEDIQIVLSTAKNSEVAISRLLHLLIQEGLNVITWTSTYLNEKLVHTIESKVCEGRSIRPYELQAKLRCLVA